MRLIWQMTLACATAVALLPAHGTSFKLSNSLDILFASGSADMQGEEISKLETLRCKVGDNRVEVMIAVGHAAADEPDAQALSEQRAQMVRQWVNKHTDWNLYNEGKGASLPIADNQLPNGRALNRRVEIELVGTYSSNPRTCQPAWIVQLLASAATAPTVADALVAQGFLRPQTPFLTALDQGRLDIFDALVQRSAIRLTSDQREVVALRALHKNNVNYFLQWVANDGTAVARRNGDSLLFRACRSEATTENRVRALDALRQAGARVGSTGTMRCVLEPEVSVDILDVLIQTGGKPYVDADLVVASGAKPPVLDRLLALGFAPNLHDSRGATLFHTVRLDSPATVQRLLDWGLDINAKAEVSDYSGTFSAHAVSPLHLAQSGCCTKVLDYMKAHGARAEDAGPFHWNTGNVAMQRWMVENGVPVTADQVTILARSGRTLPVFEALLARGINLSQFDADGRVPLAVAVEGYEVELVRFLVQTARVDVGSMRKRRGDNLVTALELAQQLTALTYPQVPIHGNVPDPMPEPQHNRALQAKKDQIIAILQNAPARP